MYNKEIKSVTVLPASKRYEYFIKKVSDFEEIWGLFNEGWAMAKDDYGNLIIPFWPKKEFAELCCQDEWSEYRPKNINLEKFLSRWVPGMEKDNKKAGVFYTLADKGIVVDIIRLKKDLDIELEKY